LGAEAPASAEAPAAEAPAAEGEPAGPDAGDAASGGVTEESRPPQA
jgi:hypothetical protein